VSVHVVFLFPRSIDTLSLSRALVVVLVESGISNVKMKKEVRTYEKATKKQKANRNLKKNRKRRPIEKKMGHSTKN